MTLSEMIVLRDSQLLATEFTLLTPPLESSHSQLLSDFTFYRVFCLYFRDLWKQ